MNNINIYYQLKNFSLCSYTYYNNIYIYCQVNNASLSRYPAESTLSSTYARNVVRNVTFL